MSLSQSKLLSLCYKAALLILFLLNCQETSTKSVTVSTTSSTSTVSAEINSSNVLKNNTSTYGTTTPSPSIASGAGDESTSNTTSSTTGAATVDSSNSNADNKTNMFKDALSKMSALLSDNKNRVQIVMFVLIGLTSLVVLYFIMKTMRLRSKKSKSRKYGVLTNGMEMDHLESDEDDLTDEDHTVFEINRR